MAFDIVDRNTLEGWKMILKPSLRMWMGRDDAGAQPMWHALTWSSVDGPGGPWLVRVSLLLAWDDRSDQKTPLHPQHMPNELACDPTCNYSLARTSKQTQAEGQLFYFSH